MVAGLDEVMDWPAVWNPDNPAHGRLWGMIGATLAGRGVVEGHGAGLTPLAINAFAAAGLAGDHEPRGAKEAREKLRRGIFIEARPQSMEAILTGLMTARPAEALDAEMQALYRAAETVEWMWEPTAIENWPPGFPERLAFATLTCAPWRWVLVAPGPLAPEGFVNVTTGQVHPLVW